MAPKMSAIVAALASASGIAESSVDAYIAPLRLDGHLQPTTRGRGARPATPSEAANLLIGLLHSGPAALREIDPTYRSSRFVATANLEMHPAALEAFETRDIMKALDIAEDERRFGAWIDGILNTLIDNPARAFCLEEGRRITHLRVDLEDAGPVARITFQPVDAIATRELVFEFRDPVLAWDAGSLGPAGDHFAVSAAKARASEAVGRVSSVSLKGSVFEAVAALFADTS